MTSHAVLLFWLALIAVHDFRKRRIPNWLVLSGGLLALAALAIEWQPFGIDWQTALLGGAVGFGFLLLFYATGLMGAGDVKFAGALGLWVGLQPLWLIWAGASLLAGMHSVLWLLLQRWPRFPRLALMLSGTPSATDSIHLRGRARIVPYAAYLALATAVWMVWGRQG